MSSTAPAIRRPKWHPTPQPPPSPKILNLPRRTRRKQPRKAAPKPPVAADNYRGRLDALFDQERTFSSSSVPVVLLNSGEGDDDGERRERVAGECEDGDGGFAEEKWMFQAEILRAECNFLRMEREFALNKFERNRLHMEKTLRSVLHTLVSGREKIYEGKNANAVLEEEIKDLEEKLEELQKSSGNDFEVRHCSNFDKEAYLLQRQLEKLGVLWDEKCVNKIREMAEASFNVNINQRSDHESFIPGHKSYNMFTDVEVLRRKMEGLSKGMLDKMEEYGSMIAATANASAPTSKRVEFPGSSLCAKQPYQASTLHDDHKCSGYCKVIVRRIIEQVRTETEQWSQMQEMLGQVREEMEELQASRDFWEDRALDSEYKIQSLRSTVKEWRKKAITFEAKASEMQKETSALRGELENLKKERDEEVTRTKDLAPISLGEHIAKEKHVLVCRLKEKPHQADKGSRQETGADRRRKTHTSSNNIGAPRRSPFQNISNTSPILRQNSKAVFPLHFPETCDA
ncbi:uncharacterized protein LOC127794671 [Diospyros lotus]|uniref:uncharacterized protein LOC127794671 n=1 Tax=Diospyros lotus TaxID=55363 RepID=UPI0022501F9C|nr:uncharacterized protein LOC127794671 [Diospyros lotus]